MFLLLYPERACLLNTITGHGFDVTINFNYAKASAKIITLFIQEMVTRGIYTNDVFYLCFTHTSEDIDKILFAAEEIFTLIKNGLENKNIEQLLKCPIRQTGFRRLA